MSTATLASHAMRRMRPSRNARPEPVTLVISRHVKPEKVAEYEAWLHEITTLASEQEGYLGVTVLRPPHGGRDPEFVTIAHFDTDANMAAWLNDPERLALIRCAAAFGDTPDEVVSEPGMEYWFTPHDAPALIAPRLAPPRWKMALVLIVLIFAMQPILREATRPLRPFLPLLLVQFINVTLQIVVLTYWVLPKLTGWLAFWLQPKAVAAV